MSGGPWISPRNAMRKLVSFEPGKMPKFSKDDDYCEIGAVTFPVEAGEDETLKPAKVERYSKNGLRRYTFRYKKPVTVRSVHMPSSKGLAGRRVYHPEISIKLSADGETVMRREAPQGAWQSNSGMTFAVDKTRSSKTWVLEFNTKHGYACSAESLEKAVSLSAARRIDNWEAKAGRELRSLEIRDGAERVKPVREKTLVFGHVNANVGRELESTEWIEVILADKAEVRRILSEEKLSLRAAFLMMQFLAMPDDDPFRFLECR
jgi:hypothetical protein